MMVQRTQGTPFSSISDCESHGRRITLSVFLPTCERAHTKRRAGVAEDIPKQSEPAVRAPTCSHFLRHTFHTFPENCTKPIKEDTVAFHAA